MENINSILMPVNQNFIEVFEVFMDENQKTKIRANNVRQYIEGIIDLLLKKTIQQHLKENELYEGVKMGTFLLWDCLHQKMCLILQRL